MPTEDEPEGLGVVAGRLQGRLGLTWTEALVLARLRAAGSHWLPLAHLRAVLPDASERAARRLVERLRRKLGLESVLGLHDSSFTLGAPGVRACRKALGDAGEAC
jgi:hypothetical protein